MEEDHCDYHPIINPRYIRGKWDQDDEDEGGDIEPEDGWINNPEIMELAVVFDPEEGKYEKCNNKKDKLREEFFEICRELGGCLVRGKLWHNHPKYEQGHGEREDRVHHCFQPRFGDPVGVILFRSAHTV